MQYDLLLVVLILIIILILCKNLYSIYIRSKWKSKRDKKNFYNIYETFNKEFSFEEFRDVWVDIADTLNLDVEKIRPSDTLHQLAKLYPFPEILFDDIEKLFIKYDIDVKYIEENTTLSDIVKIFCRKIRNN